MTGRLWHFVERRSVLISLATGVGLVSALLLWAALRMAYFDYWYEPKLEAADPGLYIYPRTRYAIFSAVEILWCMGEPWIRNVPFTRQSQTDCTSASACAGRTYSLVWLKSAKRTGRLATARRNTRNRFTEQATLEDRMKDAVTQNSSPEGEA
jgi:hypothetical protein